MTIIHTPCYILLYHAKRDWHEFRDVRMVFLFHTVNVPTPPVGTNKPGGGELWFGIMLIATFSGTGQILNFRDMKFGRDSFSMRKWHRCLPCGKYFSTFISSRVVDPRPTAQALCWRLTPLWHSLQGQRQPHSEGTAAHFCQTLCSVFPQRCWSREY